MIGSKGKVQGEGQAFKSFLDNELRRGSRIQKVGGGGVVQEFRLENRSYPDVHDFSLRMQVIIAND